MPTLLSLTQAARTLGTTREHVESLVRIGMVSTVFLDRRRMFPRSELHRLLDIGIAA